MARGHRRACMVRTDCGNRGLKSFWQLGPEKCSLMSGTLLRASSSWLIRLYSALTPLRPRLKRLPTSKKFVAEADHTWPNRRHPLSYFTSRRSGIALCE